MPGLRALALALVVWLLVPCAAFAQRPRTHVVREGDTLARIARRYRSSIDAIREANGIRGDRVREGDRLIVPREGEDPRALRRDGPEASGPARASGGPRPTKAARAASARAARLGLGSVRAGQRLLAHAPERRWIVAAGGGRTPGTLRLPLDRGRLIRGWGSGEGGYHLAIDIRERTGATVRASERGIVAYAGDAIPGYGNFVLVVHPNGWVTAYAHNRENLVVPGQIVRRGEAIARLGSTGRSQAPHLHFMLIDGGAHCDAVPLFDPPLVRHAARATWRGRQRPDEVQCLARSARPHPARARASDGAEQEGDDDTDIEAADLEPASDASARLASSDPTGAAPSDPARPDPSGPDPAGIAQ